MRFRLRAVIIFAIVSLALFIVPGLFSGKEDSKEKLRNKHGEESLIQHRERKSIGKEHSTGLKNRFVQPNVQRPRFHDSEAVKDPNGNSRNDDMILVKNGAGGGSDADRKSDKSRGVETLVRATKYSRKSRLSKSNVYRAEESFKPNCSIEKEAKANIDMYDFMSNLSVVKYIDDSSGFEIQNEREGDGSKLLETFRPSKSKLQVFVVPFSHSDPGWLRTVEEYFDEQTKDTLDNMLKKLQQYKDMTFVWSETVFFSMWWRGLNDSMKTATKKLIQDGRFEIINGAWVMTDEASSHYYAIVDEMIHGHQWLKQNVGFFPRNTWSIDPFGYSSTLPYLLQKAGHRNMAVMRIHKQVKHVFQSKRNMEFWWKQRWDLKGKDDIFCHMLPYAIYTVQDQCGPDKYICYLFDFRQDTGNGRSERVTRNNTDVLAKLLYIQYQKKAQLFRHNVVLVPLGGDFRFDRTWDWDHNYGNYSALFRYINAHNWNMDVKFGTLQDYFSAVEKASTASGRRHQYPTLTGDFFPYVDNGRSYWTGYFTTRLFNKKLSRVLEAQLRAADILNSLHFLHFSSLRGSPIRKRNWQALDYARSNLGLFQHHDAITGTSKNYVTADYVSKLYSGISDTSQVLIETLQSFLQYRDHAKSRHSNVSLVQHMVDLDQQEMFDTPKVIDVQATGTEVIFFNTLTHHRRELVHLRVDCDLAEVRDVDGKPVVSQINPIWDNKPLRYCAETHELIFYVEVPPLGISTYTIYRSKTTNKHTSVPAMVKMNEDDFNGFKLPEKSMCTFKPFRRNQEMVLENDVYRLKFSPPHWRLQSIETKADGIVTVVQMEFLLYESESGGGAYIFDPRSYALDTLDLFSPSVTRILEGPLVSEVHTLFESMLQQRLRLVHGEALRSSGIEIINIVDLLNHQGRELVMRFNTNIDNHRNTFFTDANGFQMVKRKTKLDHLVQANYYPMTNMAYLQDNSSRFSVLTAQSHGVASLKPGMLEVMFERNLQFDDYKGIGEVPNDNRRTPSKYSIMLERRHSPPDESAKVSLPSLSALALSNEMNYPLCAFQSRNSTLHFSQKLETMNAPLSRDLHVVTARKLSARRTDKSVALVIHQQGWDCGFKSPIHDVKQGPKKISLTKLFKASDVREVRETTLTFTQNLKKLAHDNVIKTSKMELGAYNITFS